MQQGHVVVGVTGPEGEEPEPAGPQGARAQAASSGGAGLKLRMPKTERAAVTVPGGRVRR
ncbi:hypothetical protein EDD95_8100 [Streptomyces sp. CEV 2-1]|nr:hypothetical protein EDD95_8100 [Streptomyces sp. CEV 2-1]